MALGGWNNLVRVSAQLNMIKSYLKKSALALSGNQQA
jgi:hypothetical protein